jgi:hypothetical protein
VGIVGSGSGGEGQRGRGVWGAPGGRRDLGGGGGGVRCRGLPDGAGSFEEWGEGDKALVGGACACGDDCARTRLLQRAACDCVWQGFAGNMVTQ